jgi:hypothetical protein
MGDDPGLNIPMIAREMEGAVKVVGIKKGWLPQNFYLTIIFK